MLTTFEKDARACCGEPTPHGDVGPTGRMRRTSLEAFLIAMPVRRRDAWCGPEALYCGQPTPPDLHGRSRLVRQAPHGLRARLARSRRRDRALPPSGDRSRGVGEGHHTTGIGRASRAQRSLARSCRHGGSPVARGPRDRPPHGPPLPARSGDRRTISSMMRSASASCPLKAETAATPTARRVASGSISRPVTSGRRDAERGSRP